MDSRTSEMVAQFRSGGTLEAIGEKHGISRERVRQVLAMNGIYGKDGGRTVRAKRNEIVRRVTRAAKRDAWMQRRYGCTEAERNAIKAIDPTVEWFYAQHKHNCDFQKIPFSLSLPEWYGVWFASNHWCEHGRYKGQYSMVRVNKTEGYIKGNVYIGLSRQNSKATMSNTWKKGLFPGKKRRVKQYA